jgi:glycosyltransferase involved in cell wall biosynthesis
MLDFYMLLKKEVESRSVLHVLTYIGSCGEYGGPVTVARSLANELAQRKIRVTVIGATIEADFDGVYENHREIRIRSRIYLQKYRFSSIFSKRILIRIFQEVKNHEVIHVHFARDLVPITASVLAIAFHKRLILQTHGMITKDSRIIVRLIDLLVKMISSKTSAILVLTSTEQEDLREVGIRSNLVIFRNGLPAHREIPPTQKIPGDHSEIIFFSRLSKSKRPKIVVEIANQLRISHPDLHFSIYGPDDGDLDELLQTIDEFQISDHVKYGGALNPSEVIEVIRGCSLVLLPSLRDPYPMVVLETLRLGKPVIVSPDCGQADLLREHDSRFVSEGFLPEDYIHRIKEMKRANFLRDEEDRLIEIFHREFDIASISSKLMDVYFDE